ncbi:hypothetical protein HKCCSP123_06270 [Rhodobacterales bacterium HKCCSP123]|nr:hypothetical protein [Rhodobacterales bacterium HKCCSP123]
MTPLSGGPGAGRLSSDSNDDTTGTTGTGDLSGAANAPDAVDDPALTTDSLTPLTIDVLANDTHPDGDLLTVSNPVLNDPAFGTAVVLGNQIVFTPSPASIGQPVEITYTATGPDGRSDTATAFVTVTRAPPPQGDVDGGKTGGIMGRLADASAADASATDGTAADGAGADDDIAVGGSAVAVGGSGDDVFTLDPADPADGLVPVTLDGGTDGTDGNPEGPENGDAGDILDLSDRFETLVVELGTDPETGTVDGLDGDATPDIAFAEIEKILTGRGDDTIDGGAAASAIHVDTGSGNDEVIGGAGDDTIVTGEDDDFVAAGGGDDSVEGGSGTDVLEGGEGADTLRGGEGSDTLEGGPGADLLDGGEDDDILTLAPGDSGLGGGGDDVFLLDPAGTVGPRTISLVGGETDEGGANTTNDAYPGAPNPVGDVLDLRGLDVVLVSYDPTDPSFDPVTGLGERGTVIVKDANGDPITIEFSQIETLLFDAPDGGVVEGEETGEVMGPGYDDGNLPTDGGGDPITDGADVIDGRGGSDVISAGGGDDIVDGGADNDTINGEAGDDLLIGGSGDDLLSGGLDDDILLGGTGDDQLFGNDGNDSVQGGDGNDRIGGAEGADTLQGGSGADTLTGGSGDDVLDGGGSDDTINGSSGNDRITDLDGHTLVTAGVDGLPDRGFPFLGTADPVPADDIDVVTTGAGDDTISTGDDADVIDAGDGNNVIDGGFDDDDITSGSGGDRIASGEGSDTVSSGDGNDTIYGGVGALGGDSVNLVDENLLPSRNDPVTDNGDDLIDAGAGDDLVFGEDDDDTIFGGAGNDTLDGGIDDDVVEGGAGNDVILGGQGADSLSGGLGSDTFTVGLFTDPIHGDTYAEGAGDTVAGGEDPGDVDVDVLDLSGAGPLRIVVDDAVDPTGTPGESGTVTFFTDAAQTTVAGTLTFSGIENVIPCFTPGSLIATPKGEVPVESLKEGEKVITRDNGIQEIRWLGRRTLTRQHLARAPNLKPVLIAAGALGNGLPERDMLVSPQHRMLISGDRTQLYFDESEVLVAAKHLVNHGSIRMVDTLRTTYIHFMFDRHEVVLSDGAWTESFQPGDQTLGAMGRETRDEIVALFPELATSEGISDYTSARRALRAHEAKLLQL